MTTCLLCDSPLRQPIRFTDILLCRKTRPSACKDCLAGFVPIGDTHCPTCYSTKTTTDCPNCHYWHQQGETVQHRSLYVYTEEMAAYFQRFKFQGDYLLRQVFAASLAEALKQEKNYTIVPIPISPKRMEERGFNQVTGLLEAAGLPYQDLLGKKETDKQSSKTRTQRLAGEQPFFLKEDGPIPPNILLVDDIYTTGATIQHAVRLFVKMGAKEIKTFSLSR